MSLRRERFNLVSIIDLMFSFTGILLFLIWGFSSFPAERELKKAKASLHDYYSFIVKKAEVSNIKAKREFLFMLKPMVFIVDSDKTLKYISRNGRVSVITWSELEDKLSICIKDNEKLIRRKHLCGAVFLVPEEGFPFVKRLERNVWDFMRNRKNFLPLSYIPMEEEVYRRVKPLWKR